MIDENYHELPDRTFFTAKTMDGKFTPILMKVSGKSATRVFAGHLPANYRTGFCDVINWPMMDTQYPVDVVELSDADLEDSLV